MAARHGGGAMKDEIVVGLDDSPSAKAALAWAAEHAKAIDAVLRAVHVLDWPYGLSPAGFPAPANFMDLSRKEIQVPYRQAITAVFQAVSPRSDWILQFASGDTGRVLVQQSEDARLLVVGTREHVGLGRLLNGSVSHYCLSHAACPVLAVPAPLSDGIAEPSDTVEAAAITETDQDAAVAVQAAERWTDEAETVGTPLVVAGVDASAEGLAAAQYAVMAAELRGGEVVLVHAFPPASARADYQDAALSAGRASAKKLLGAVTEQLVIPPGLQLSTRIEPWDPVSVLAESARRAAILVLGRDHVSWGERLFMGAVTPQIVGLIPCPLVVVPGGWRPRYAVPRLPVIVTLDGQSDPEPPLQLAFEEARLRDVHLIALHAQPMSATSDDKDAAHLDLRVVLADWEQHHPDIAVSTAVVSGDADAQLVRWSRSAGVLVVGHPRQRGWGSAWTRSVARSVMKQTHCPLIVAPKTTLQGVRDRELADQART
jgi:nucleotide-binding universal stress UspA family protein